jgi:hypothetical protein
MQIETGTKLIKTCSNPTFIYATFWPSWMFAAKARGFSNLFLYLEDATELVKEMCIGLEMKGLKLCALKDWLQELVKASMQRSESCVYVFVQGPIAPVKEKVKRWLETDSQVAQGNQRIRLIAGLTSDRKLSKGIVGHTRTSRAKGEGSGGEGQSVFNMSHEQVGGAIDGMWTFWCNWTLTHSELRRLEVDNKVKSLLSDYLSDTLEGIKCEKPPTMKGLRNMKWGKMEWKVKTKSVFSTTGWVMRKMSEDEMMDVYDISRSDRKVLQALAEERGQLQHQLAFVRQIPARVLLRCLDSLVSYDVRDSENEASQAAQTSFKKLKQVNCPLETERLEEELMSNAWGESKAFKDVRSEEVKKLEAKNDDAQANVIEWNRRACATSVSVYCDKTHRKACDILRALLLRRYRSFRYGVIRSFRRFMSEKYGNDWLDVMRSSRRKKRKGEIIRDYDVGMDGIHRALKASFWDWDDGSTLLFWRWPSELHKELREGTRVWYRKRDLPRYWGRQRWPENQRECCQLKEKISKVVERRYITAGYVSSLTSFFAVPKGTEDIRVVYDASRSGLNDAIWTPNFFLPTISSVVNNASEEAHFGDIDIGEMFLNYFLDSSLRHKVGVDLTRLAVEWNTGLKADQRLIMRWERSLMGVRSSPFNCVKIYLLGEDIIRGDRKDERNPMRWDKVMFNLPGSKGYDPTRPWIYKYDMKNQRLAAFVVSYVDDLRTGCHGSKEDGDKVTHYVASRLNYLGQQDAPRKRGSASQQPGPWAGAMIEAVPDEGIYVTISQEKWERVKAILKNYLETTTLAADGEDIWVDLKHLEQDTGFLVHVMMTYENLRPFMKGFYLTLNGWRFDRDDEGWKVGRDYWEDLASEYWNDVKQWEEARELKKSTKRLQTPDKVLMVPRMKQDLEILAAMFANDRPARRLVRGKKIARVLYGFGDASGTGFGASWVSPEHSHEGATALQGDGGLSCSPKVNYRFGRWGSEMDGSSSNFRELKNLVDALEGMGSAGDLSGVEVFLFTDNATAEAAFFRGSSSSVKLFELVKRLKILEMCRNTRLHLIHVAGKRMISQGTDGLSRGVLAEGVMSGDPMAAFIPLHESALDRSQVLLEWLRIHCSISETMMFEALSPEDWYVKGHDIIGGTVNVDGVWVPSYGVGNYIWAPPPCIAAQCLEELRKARHKRQVSSHVFVCPRIMTASWQRQLYRSADLVFTLNPGHEVWDLSQHEPLLVGLYFPFLETEPWQLKGSTRLLEMGRHLQHMCKTNSSSSGCLLRQLWVFSRQLSKMSEQLVLQMLQGSSNTDLPKTAPGK